MSWICLNPWREVSSASCCTNLTSSSFRLASFSFSMLSLFAPLLLLLRSIIPTLERSRDCVDLEFRDWSNTKQNKYKQINKYLRHLSHPMFENRTIVWNFHSTEAPIWKTLKGSTYFQPQKAFPVWRVPRGRIVFIWYTSKCELISLKWSISIFISRIPWVAM